MAQIHGIEVDVRDSEHNSIRHLVKSWEDHETDFREMRHAVDNDPNNKIYIGADVFEKKEGTYVLRKSSQSY
ncbi:MAG: hypothetical protein NTZ44_02235 [Candidatus Nomurabacteria bacterium]|nr:hypothetical protein [Candidatus Nomurabacteria bacterium]